MSVQPLTIGRLAKAAGVHVETVRYYQRLGLVEEPPKPYGSVRRYPPAMIDRIRFIKRAQQLGFKLKEIAELLEMGAGHCRDVRERAEEKRCQIDEQIADLRALRRTLDGLIAACRGGDEQAPCPIVESLLGRNGE